MPEIEFVLSHECLHVALDHFSRAGLRIKELFNVANDAWINTRLEKSGLKKLSYGIYIDTLNKDFKGLNLTDNMSSEEIYDKLKPKVKIIEVPCGFDAHINDKNKKDGNGQPKDSKAGAKEWGNRIQKAATIAKQMGKLPGGFEKLFDDMFGDGKLPWHRILAKYLNNIIFSGDYSYRIPSRFSRIFDDFVTPIADTNKEITVALAVDTSGSVSDELYLDFISEMMKIAKQYKGRVKMALVTCDAAVQDTLKEDSKPKEVLKKLRKRSGYGGTNLSPAFDWMQENLKKARVCVFFTDLYATFPTYKPRLPVIWVVPPESKTERVPFGTIVSMDKR